MWLLWRRTTQTSCCLLRPRPQPLPSVSTTTAPSQRLCTDNRRAWQPLPMKRDTQPPARLVQDFALPWPILSWKGLPCGLRPLQPRPPSLPACPPSLGVRPTHGAQTPHCTSTLWGRSHACAGLSRCLPLGRSG